MAQNNLRARLVKTSSTSVVLKALSAVLGFGTTIILARTLGPENYGLYVYILAIVTVISLPVRAGLPQLVTRETAKAQAQNDLSIMKGIWFWSTSMLVGISAVLLALGATLATLNTVGLNEIQLTTFITALFLVPLMGFAGIRSAALRGLGYTIKGQLPELTIKPAVFLLLLAGFAVFYSSGQISPRQAMTLNVISATTAFVIGAILLGRNRPSHLDASKAKYHSRPWIGAIMPMAAINGMHLVNTQADIILIGLFMDESDVGHYRVAAQTSLIIAFGLQATKMVVEPHFSSLYHKGDFKNLQRLATAASRVNICVAIAILIPIFFWGTEFLQIAFGSVFAAAYLPMLILSAGRLFSSAVGSSGHLLNMAGYQKNYAAFWLIAATLNIILNVLLIPTFGTVGASTATALTLILAHILGWWGARRWIGCDCSPL